MEIEILGWPSDDPTVRLDWRRFSYAGKFVMTNTGKAVARDPDESTTAGEDGDFADVVAAISFNEDRTDDDVCWIRYVTVRADRRGEGVGTRLAAAVVDAAVDRGYERVRIAVNNPFAYQSLYRAGFCFTGRETGIAELVLETPCPDPSDETYRDGLARYRDRDDLGEDERRFVDDHLDDGRPPVRNRSSDGT